MTRVLLHITMFALLSAGLHAEVAVTDAKGRITAINSAGEYLPITMTMRVPLAGWSRQPDLSEATSVKYARDNGRATWEGRLELTKGAFYRYRQTTIEQDGALHIDLQVTAEATVDTEGVYLFLDVPRELFQGGAAQVSRTHTPVASADLPVGQPAARHFLQGTGDGLSLADAAEKTVLELSYDRELSITVQDTREWNGSTYSAFCQLTGGLQAGQTTSIGITLRVDSQPDTRGAVLSLDAGKVRYRLDGFGGNYCFNIESPVTQYTLSNLNVAWARTEMTLREWEPQNDNEDPGQADWAYFEGRDRPDSNLRREFLLARQIQDKGIPYVISIWHLPAWLYADGGTQPASSRHTVDPAKWPELLECIGTYLQYAKRQYGVEPDLFSFNEANIGVYVLFTAQEHREALKRIGEHLKGLGLGTKMLLADATGPRGTHTYALPASEDPQAMGYVGAIGFHSWGGGTADDYRAWGDLAQRLKLPLLVTELGVDSGAWRSRAFDNYHYAVREMRMYQELLLHARPRGTMQWEFTADYSIVEQQSDADGKTLITPTARYHLVKHFCNLTPRGAEALTTSADNPKVLFTAFRGQVAGRVVYTLHVVNTGPGRQATIKGIPAGVDSLRAVRTGEREGFAQLGQVPVEGGTVRLQLAANSLVSLTTMPPAAPEGTVDPASGR